MTINTDTAGESYYPNTNNRLGQLIPCRLLLESVEGRKLCKQTSQSTNAVCTQLCRQGPVSISQILPPLLRGKALCTEQTRCRHSNMLVGTRHDQKLHHVPTTRKKFLPVSTPPSCNGTASLHQGFHIYCLQTLQDKESQDESIREMDFVKLLQGSSYSAGGCNSTCRKMPARSSSGPRTRTWLKARIRL